MKEKLLPASLRNFFGQDKIKKRLNFLFEKFERTGGFSGSIFIYGPIGSGKNSIIKIISKRTNKEIINLAENIDSASLVSELLSTSYPAIFVIDSLEQTKLSVQKILSKIIKENTLKIFIDKNEKPITVNLKDKIIIGVSNRAGVIPKFIRENFSEVWHMEKYKIREIKKIIANLGKRQKIELDNDAAWEIAYASRKNPKRAIKLLENIIDFSNRKKIDLALTQKFLNSIGIDRIGLEKFDRDLLKVIIEKFSGGPVGIENYAAKLSESPWNIEEIYEPYLIEIGFLKRTPKGRIVTREAHEYLGYQYSVGKPGQKTYTTSVSRGQKKLF